MLIAPKNNAYSTFIILFGAILWYNKSMKKFQSKNFSSCLAKPLIKGVVLMEIITKKYPYNNYQDNERTVCSLKEIEKRKIVEHNDLITSVAKMDKTPLKIFELAVSCIDTENPPKDNIIYLSKNDKEIFANVSTSLVYDESQKPMGTVSIMVMGRSGSGYTMILLSYTMFIPTYPTNAETYRSTLSFFMINGLKWKLPRAPTSQPFHSSV